MADSRFEFVKDCFFYGFPCREVSAPTFESLFVSLPLDLNDVAIARECITDFAFNSLPDYLDLNEVQSQFGFLPSAFNLNRYLQYCFVRYCVDLLRECCCLQAPSSMDSFFDNWFDNPKVLRFIISRFIGFIPMYSNFLRSFFEVV